VGNTDSQGVTPVKAFWTAAAKHPIDTDGLRPTARDPYLQLAIESAIEKWLQGGRLLDVGCGDGLSTLRFARRMDEAVGVDYVEDFVSRAKENAAKHGMQVTFEHADALDLSAVRSEYGQFDALTSIRCLINLTSWDRQRTALAEFASCLEPGGLLFVSEGWTDGFAGLNLRRQRADLPAIALAQYNLMIERDQFEAEAHKYFDFVGYEPMGFYLFISRVFMPKFVSPDPPSHTHSLNKLASDFQIHGVDRHAFTDCDYAGVYVLRRKD
jgi:2-polyprenyl-3-methyl-5-hydroxy-6-metoxy-1,4-benzoquinol methylase